MVAVLEKIRWLENWIKRNPGLADVPTMVVRGQHLSAKDALRWLRAGRFVVEVMEALARAGLDPTPEELWQLAEEHLKRLLALPPPRPSIAVIGQEVLSLEEMLDHVRKRTKLGEEFVRSYESLLREVRKRA